MTDTHVPYGHAVSVTATADTFGHVDLAVVRQEGGENTSRMLTVLSRAQARELAIALQHAAIDADYLTVATATDDYAQDVIEHGEGNDR